MKENRFCFVAIVRNEAHVMHRCIDSIANMATSYLICDTGSTDGTPEIIEKYMEEKGIPGEVIHKEWKDYGYNKSYLLDQAYTENKSSNAKYLIWHDADEVFLTNPADLTSYPTKEDADKLYQWLESNTTSVIYIKTIHGDLHYKRWNIVRNNQLFKWISPKHEWLLGTKDNSSVNYHGFILLARKEGSASRDPLRCQKDVNLFLNYIKENGGPSKCGREVFYLAQEYESFDREKSIEYYILKTTLVNDWDQEKYISYLRLGRLCDKIEDKIRYWAAGTQLVPTRLECLYELMNYYRLKNDWPNALRWGNTALENREPNENDLFIESLTYSYLFDLDYSVVAYYSGRYQLANDINQRVMLRNKNTPHMERLLINQKFIEQKIQELNLTKLHPQTALMNLHEFRPSFDKDSRSPDIRPAIILIDGFYPDPDAVRRTALAEDFSVKGNYPGGRTKSFATDSLKKRFENIIGKTITYWPDGYNGAFQYTTAANKSWIHRDMTDYSGIIYLTPNPPPDAGTVLYRHKATGKQFTNNDDEEKILNNDANNDTAWDIMDVVGNKYNRCILFNGKCSHKSNVYFGTNKEDGRLFQTFFFDTTK